jgi:hypothetical protein
MHPAQLATDPNEPAEQELDSGEQADRVSAFQ